ncbi:MAG TPA: glycosyltransferase [Chitinophagaceae bacterium]|nr:glycosyltransferase [Chitinophagaceae bacterium]
MTLLYITIGFLVVYSILILFYRAGWQELKPFSQPGLPPSIEISVIIAARNEEENIGKLLTSLEKQTYPRHLFEVIVVDDHSTDKTATIVNSFSFAKLIKLQLDNINSYKKKAIETGIAAASGDLIVTTDADCIVKESWLRTIAAFKEETNAIFIAAPVMMEYRSNLLQTFQTLDFLVLQGITAASVQKRIHNMCNGANLAYERKVFFEVNGFSGIDHIASGDDMLLMQKIAKRFPGKISYLLSKEAVTTTQAAKTWKELFSQRIRWASKATNYNDIKIFGALFLVYFFNCALLGLLIAGFWMHFLWSGFVGILIIKTFIELLFIYPVAKFYNKLSLLKLFPFFQPLHIVYTVIAGWFGVFGRFEWKGRRVK